MYDLDVTGKPSIFKIIRSESRNSVLFILGPLSSESSESLSSEAGRPARPDRLCGGDGSEAPARVVSSRSFFFFGSLAGIVPSDVNYLQTLNDLDLFCRMIYCRRILIHFSFIRDIKKSKKGILKKEIECRPPSRSRMYTGASVLATQSDRFCLPLRETDVSMYV